MNDSRLRAAALRSDPRIAQARELLRSALEDHRREISCVCPPREELKEGYCETIARFANQRGGPLFYPYLGSGLGRGSLVELADGSVKYDMISGIGVHALGHSDPQLLDALLDAALEDTVMQGNLQQDSTSALLVNDFVEIACESGAALTHCFLTTSGAMANENALKLLFQKRAPATRMLAFANCFSGRTLATSQLTDRAKNRMGLPTVLAVDYLPFFDFRHPETSLQTTLSRLREYLERYPQDYAGMILELIQGEGGYYSAPREFLAGLCDELKKHQIPVWFDEIQTFGRTTRPFAFQHFALDQFADVVTVGKMTQVCATLFTDEFVPGLGLISQTFTGATSMIFAARHLLHRLRSGNILGRDGRIMEVHHLFSRNFEALHEAQPELISGPWGLGGMIAFTPLNGTAPAAKQVLEWLFQQGVIAFSAGAEPTRIRMLPPCAVITNEEIEDVCRIIANVLSECSE